MSHVDEPLLDSHDVDALRSRRRAATWILKVQETYKLTQSTMDSDVTGFFQDLLSNLFEELKSALMKYGVDPTTIPGVSVI